MILWSYYRFLYLFTKYYNKRYIAEEDKVKWEKLQENKKISHILACMISASGTTFKEIIPEKGGRRKPGSIYVANTH